MIYVILQLVPRNVKSVTLMDLLGVTLTGVLLATTSVPAPRCVTVSELIVVLHYVYNRAIYSQNIPILLCCSSFIP